MATGMSTACWSMCLHVAQLVGLCLHVAQPLGDKDGHKDEYSLLVKVYM